MQYHVVCEQSMLIVKLFQLEQAEKGTNYKIAQTTGKTKYRFTKICSMIINLTFLTLRKRGDKLWTKIQQYKLCLHSSDRGQEWGRLHKTRGGDCNLHNMYSILFQDIPGETPSTTGSVADLRDYTRQSDNQCCGCLIQ